MNEWMANNLMSFMMWLLPLGKAHHNGCYDGDCDGDAYGDGYAYNNNIEIVVLLTDLMLMF